MGSIPKTGLILYVHGARDPRWAEPFMALAERVRRRAPGRPVSIAFLEHGQPGLVEAAAHMAQDGVRHVRVALMFFGRGGHLREDFPLQLADAQRRLPELQFDITGAAAEDVQVLDALAAFALEGPAQSAADFMKKTKQEA
jgi:sirohydrochlorin cobaltochelatase